MKSVIRIVVVVGGLLVVAGILAGIKGLQINRMVAHGKTFVPPPETVSAVQVSAQTWESVLTAVGSLQAVQGVMVASELAGRVTQIGFESGTRVAADTLLLQQDISAELADQRAAQSDVTLARKNYERALELIPDKVISKSSFDDTKARHEQAVARLEYLRAVIAKKTVKAPFAGNLGLRQVNLGEMLAPGQPIVTLQSLDPIYVNFSLPQQHFTRIQKAMRVKVMTDGLDGRQIEGVISAINAEVESASRNIRIQATVSNSKGELRPGMFANVVVVLPEQRPVLAIPITAVLHAPYSDAVFVIEEKADAAGQITRIVRQQFVELGEENGDFVAVRSGLRVGQTVVSAGVFKLRNSQSVVVDNTVAPQFQLQPQPQDA